MRPEVRADLEAAKARLMHVLYVGAHGVQVALNRDLRDLAVLPARKRAALPAESVKRTVEARDRMAAFEQLAGAYVSGTFPAALQGEHKPRPEPDRLRQALATWDVQAHRALAGTSTAATMTLVAQTQAHTAFASQTLLRAAAETGAIEPRQYRSRLAPALESVQAAWVALARTWCPAGTVSTDDGWTVTWSWRPTRSAPRCSSSFTTAPAHASADTLAATVDLRQASHTLALGLATSTDLAYAVRDATATRSCWGRPAGSTPSRWRWRRTARTATSPAEAWVRPVDHAQDRSVALPDTVRDSLTAAADRAAHAATTASGAAAFLNNPDRVNVLETLAKEPEPQAHRRRRPGVSHVAAPSNTSRSCVGRT